jgi:hypothetical protein
MRINGMPLNQLREYGSASIHRTASSAGQSGINTPKIQNNFKSAECSNTPKLASVQYWVTET